MYHDILGVMMTSGIFFQKMCQMSYNHERSFFPWKIILNASAMIKPKFESVSNHVVLGQEIMSCRVSLSCVSSCSTLEQIRLVL